MPRFRYQPRKPEDLLRRIKKYEFDKGFEKALRDAYRRKTTSLRDLLCSPNPPLTSDNLRQLANLIDRRMGAKRRGRPKGPVFMSPARIMEDQIADKVSAELSRLRERNGRKPMPRGTVDKVIKKVCDEFGNLYDGDAPELADVDLDNERNAVKRGAKAKPRAR